MRINLRISANKELVPFTYQHLLTGAIHKWLGDNQDHGAVSLYSFSNLTGSKLKNKQLDFPDGAEFSISAWDDTFIRKIIAGVMKDKDLICGMHVKEIVLIKTPNFSNQELFYASSPVFIKRIEEDRVRHIIYSDADADNCLKETLETKLKIAEIEYDSFEIAFDQSYSKAKTKLIKYKDIDNKTSVCPVVIKGDTIVKEFAWTVGLGNSTGIGFGALK